MTSCDPTLYLTEVPFLLSHWTACILDAGDTSIGGEVSSLSAHDRPLSFRRVWELGKRNKLAAGGDGSSREFHAAARAEGDGGAYCLLLLPGTGCSGSGFRIHVFVTVVTVVAGGVAIVGRDVTPSLIDHENPLVRGVVGRTGDGDCCMIVGETDRGRDARPSDIVRVTHENPGGGVVGDAEEPLDTELCLRRRCSWY